MRTFAMLACFVVAASCSDDNKPAEPAHLPVVADLGGPKMAHPQLVSIFFADDPNVTTLTSFSQYVVTSRWLDDVGAEYGVGAGSVLGVVHRPEAAPDAINDTQIVDLIYQGLAAGTLPPPTPDVLYTVFFPEHTVVTSFQQISCVDFGGYHASARRNGVELSYAVVATCADFGFGLNPLEASEFIASHELIEAATDPIPSNHPGMQLRDPTSSWSALGVEVGDLCEGSGTAVWREGGFALQRSWSNAAAMTGDPCVPVPTLRSYYNVVAEGGPLPRILPGAQKVLNLTGWTTGTSPNWTLSAQSAKQGDATVTLAASTMNAGTSTTLTVAVPAATPRRSLLQLFVFSAFSQNEYQMLPMIAIVDDPCSSFSGCAACTSHPGCGFCVTSGRCEAEGAAGSAESSCPASSFATWVGSCPGVCAAHSGSCGDCASQSGCGWCATGGAPHCMEASHDAAQPATETCAYADWSFTPDYCSP